MENPSPPISSPPPPPPPPLRTDGAMEEMRIAVEEGEFHQQLPTSSRLHSFNDSLRSIPKKRAVVYGVCALFFTTVVIVINLFVDFLENLIRNESWWDYMSRETPCDFMLRPINSSRN